MSACVDRGVSRASPLTRRQFIETTATSGLFGLLAVRRAPVFAQRREVSMITWNHFVPASDERLKEIAADFSKRHNVNLRVDTMAHLQLPAKLAAEVQTKTGHDLIFMYNELPYLYERQLIPMDDLVGVVERKYGGLYPFTKESVRYFENHPVWANDPKLALLPKEGEYAHPAGWPSPPNQYVVQTMNAFILPDMVAKVIQGASTKDAITWAEEQITRMVKG
jgi:hypothetical protein